MAARFVDALGVEPNLIPAGGGIFDVVVDEALVYSKHQTGTFPDHDSLVKTIVKR